MRVIDTPRGKPATHAEIASIEFKGVGEYRAMSQKQRVTRLRKAYDEIYAMSVLASQIVAHDKPKLVEIVTEKYDEFGPFLMMLANARERAFGITELIGAAECRLAAALAVVEPDPGD